MPVLSNISLGQEARRSSLYDAVQLDASYSPTTSEVVDAYVDETWEGVGSMRAASFASAVERYEKNSVKISEEEYKEGEFFREDIPYYPGMSIESARALAENHDDVTERGFIISQADTWQDFAGFGAALGTGIFEPRNFASGLGVNAVGGAVAKTTVGAKRIAEASKKYGKYKVRAGMGFTEGLVASAILEPGNLETAKILRQDYGMADSLWNVGLSTILGTGLTTIPPLVREKMAKRKVKQMTREVVDEVMDDLDTAVAQTVEGKLVDVNAVEKIRQGEISKKPLAKKAEAVEQFVRYTESDEFKTRFEGSKVVDADGAPLRVYHGTNADFKQFKGDVIFFTENPELANIYAERGQGGNVRPAYINAKNTFDTRLPEHQKIFEEEFFRKHGNGAPLSDKGLPDWTDAEDFKDFFASTGRDFDSVMIQEPQGDASFAVFSPEQIIPAFGEGVDVNTLAKDIDLESVAEISKAVKKATTNYDESTVDIEQIRKNQEYQDTLALQDRVAQFEEEMNVLREENLLDPEELRTLEALGEINEDDILAAYDAAYICMTRG